MVFSKNPQKVKTVQSLQRTCAKVCTALFTFPNMQSSPTGQQHLIIGFVFHNFLFATCLHYFFVFRPQVQASFYFSFEERAQNWWQFAF